MGQRRRKKKLVCLKLDIEKAYDTVRWPFLEKSLLNLGFLTNMASIIMGHVSSSSFMVKVNGELSEEFRAERRLRQGDTLSPYPYLVCGKALTRVINHLGSVRRLPIPRLSQGGERVGTLQFADELLNFFSILQRKQLRPYLRPWTFLRNWQVKELIKPNHGSFFPLIPHEDPR